MYNVFRNKKKCKFYKHYDGTSETSSISPYCTVPMYPFFPSGGVVFLVLFSPTIHRFLPFPNGRYPLSPGVPIRSRPALPITSPDPLETKMTHPLSSFHAVQNTSY